MFDLMKPLKECAPYYAKQWNQQDQPLFQGLLPNNAEDNRLATLRSLCGTYKVARSLRRKYDEEKGLPRYRPLLALIDACREEYPRAMDAKEVVHWFRENLSRHYGGVRALSLSSKVLWFVYRSPILIYDQLARMALGVRPGDYGSYQLQWRAMYSQFAEEISAASSKFSKDQWFRDRVFDIYLWHIGNEMRSNKALQPTPKSRRG